MCLHNSNLFILLHSTPIPIHRQIGQSSVACSQQTTAIMVNHSRHSSRQRNSSSPIHPPYSAYLPPTQKESLFLSPRRQICRYERSVDFVNVAFGDYRLAKCPAFCARVTSQRTLRSTMKD